MEFVALKSELLFKVMHLRTCLLVLEPCLASYVGTCFLRVGWFMFNLYFLSAAFLSVIDIFVVGTMVCSTLTYDKLISWTF